MRTSFLGAVLALTVFGAQQPAPPDPGLPMLYYWTRSYVDGRESEGEGLLRRMRTHLDVQYRDVKAPRFFASPFGGERAVHGFTPFEDVDARRRFELRAGADARWAALQEEARGPFRAEGAWSGYLFPLGGASEEDPLKPYRLMWVARTPPSRRFVARRLAREIAEHLEGRYQAVDARAYAADLHEPGTIFLSVDYYDLDSWQAVQSDLLEDGVYLALQERMEGLFLDEDARETMLLDLEFDPEEATPHYVQGRAFHQRGELPMAIACYRRALDIDPDATVVHHQLGHALLKTRENAAAVRSFRRRIELDPGIAEAHRDLAWALEGTGDLAGMRENFRAALRIDPDDPDSMNVLAWALVSTPGAEARNLEEALELSGRATELAPLEGDVWGTRGAVLYRAGALQAATEALTRAMELSDGGGAYEWFFLAMINHRAGDEGEARQWFERSLAWMAAREEPEDELARLRAEAKEVLGTGR